MTKRILHVVTNRGFYEDRSQPTGLWLSELVHAWHVFEEHGYDQTIISPKGGETPLEPRSLKWPVADAATRTWLSDPSRLALLQKTAKPEEIDPHDFDAIYFTGGHGVMWDFPDALDLQATTRGIYERGGVVSAVCHGYCGLFNVKLSDDKLLVAGRRITGYAWMEEILAGVAGKVPYNAEKLMKQRGARYEKAFLPFVSKVVIDGRLITGQNPASARATAIAVTETLRTSSEIAHNRRVSV